MSSVNLTVPCTLCAPWTRLIILPQDGNYRETHDMLIRNTGHVHPSPDADGRVLRDDHRVASPDGLDERRRVIAPTRRERTRRVRPGPRRLPSRVCTYDASHGPQSDQFQEQM